MKKKEEPRAILGFTMNERAVRLSIPMPDRRSDEIAKTPGGENRSEQAVEAAYDQAVRQVWRAVLLIVKSKLEAIESGIVSFDEKFMPHIVMPDGKTMRETILQDMRRSLSEGSAPPMLPDYSGGC
ncbi:MAG: hypothetical protein AAF950_18280 [Pseudomonadota bacterium]